MNSGKTIEILKVAYNYEEQGRSCDYDFGSGYKRRYRLCVESDWHEATSHIAIENDTDIYGLIQEIRKLNPTVF